MPLELGCMEATHLSSMACKVSATARPDVGTGKRRGRQVKPLVANGCLVAKDLMSRKRRPALFDHQLMSWLTAPTPHPK